MPQLDPKAPKAEPAVPEVPKPAEPTVPVVEEKPAPRARLLDTLTPVSNNREFVNALWWGEEGTGKTTDLASLVNLPGTGKLIIINAEAGVKKRALERLDIDTSRIVLWPPHGVAISYNNMDRLRRQIATQIEEEPGSILGVGWDSLSEISEQVMDLAVKRGIKSAQERGNDRLGDEFDVEQSDWGVMTNQVKKLLRGYRDLKCHFGATALERVFSPKKNEVGIDQLGPALNPGLASKALGFFDYCLRTTADNVTVSEDEAEILATAWTRKTKKIRAKSRDGILPVRWPEPTFDRLVAYDKGELTTATDEAFKIHADIRARNAAYVAAKTASPATKES